jgi:hypothetical protein
MILEPQQLQLVLLPLNHARAVPTLLQQLQQLQQLQRLFSTPAAWPCWVSKHVRAIARGRVRMRDRERVRVRVRVRERVRERERERAGDSRAVMHLSPVLCVCARADGRWQTA